MDTIREQKRWYVEGEQIRMSIRHCGRQCAPLSERVSSQVETDTHIYLQKSARRRTSEEESSEKVWRP